MRITRSAIRIAAAITCLSSAISLGSVTAFAAQSAATLKPVQDLVIEGLYSVQNHTNYTADASADSLNYPGGVYLYDDNGLIHYTTAEGSIYAGGVADDGQYYDADGVQVNSLEYIGKRYKGAFQRASGNQMIQFQSLSHLKLFMYWYIHQYASSQGIEFTYHRGDNGKVSIAKSEFEKYPTTFGDDYKAAIAADAAAIDLSLPFKEKLEQALRLTHNRFQYDLSYTMTDINQALADGRGVCFHYAKYCHDLLASINIESQYLIGSGNTNSKKDPSVIHVWLSAKDPDTGKTHYLDPTDLFAGMLLFNAPELGIWNYTQAGINDAYIGRVGEHH